MSESKMGNRGSKSVLVKNIDIVKEQRVDGSYLFKPNKLRCTLTGFERSLKINHPSNLKFILLT